MPFEYIKSDLYRYCGNTSLKFFFKNYILNRGFNFSVWLRLANSKGLLGKLARLILLYKARKYGIDISYKLTKITKHAKRHFWLNDVCTCHGLLPSHSA